MYTNYSAIKCRKISHIGVFVKAIAYKPKIPTKNLWGYGLFKVLLHFLNLTLSTAISQSAISSYQ